MFGLRKIEHWKPLVLADFTETRVSISKDGKYVWKFETQEIQDLRARIISARETCVRDIRDKPLDTVQHNYNQIMLDILFEKYFDTVEKWLQDTKQ